MRRFVIISAFVVAGLSIVTAHHSAAQVSTRLRNTGSSWVPVSATDWVDLTKLCIISFDSPGRLVNGDGQTVALSGAIDLTALKAKLSTEPSNWIRVRTAVLGDDEVLLANLEYAGVVSANQAADGLEYRLTFPGSAPRVAAHTRASLMAVEQMLRSGLPPKGGFVLNRIEVFPTTTPSGSTSRPSQTRYPQ